MTTERLSAAVTSVAMLPCRYIALFALLVPGTAWSAPEDDPTEPSEDAPAGDAPAGEPASGATPADDLPTELPFSFGEAGGETTAPEPEPAARPQTFASGYRWEPTAPPTLRDISDIAVHPDDSTLVAFVTSDGTAWLSDDGGLRWRRVLASERSLGSTVDEEGILRDVEAFVQDVTDDVQADDPSEFEDFEDAEAEAEALAAALQDATQDAASAVDDIRGDLETGVALLDAAATAGGPSRVWWGPAGELFVGRFDGLHLSTDNGGRFESVLDVQVLALTYLRERRLWVAGTADGVRWALDPRGWIDAEDATTGVEVRDLSVGPEGVYAATDDGVYFAPDAQSWERLGPPSSYLAIEADPDWPGGFWVSSEAGVLRSDDRGTTLRASLGAPLRGVVDIVRIAPGQLLVATDSDGPWESMDGGTRFKPLSSGLSDADTRAVSIRGRTVYLASAEGPMRLVKAEATGLDEAPFVPLGELLSAATTRPGLVPRGPTAASLLQKVLPSLVVEGYRRSGDLLQWDGGSAFDDDAEWRVVSRLVFSPRPGRRISSGGDVAPSVVVLGGDVELITDGEGLTGSMDRRGRRGALSYRATLIKRIAAVHGARVELAGRPTTELTLSEAVELELRLRELDAELDLLTDGTVSSWLMSPREEG